MALSAPGRPAVPVVPGAAGRTVRATTRPSLPAQGPSLRKVRMNALLSPIPGAEQRDVGGARIEQVRVGDARVRRAIYPAGFRWSSNVQPVAGTERCMHAHVGFLANGQIEGEYGDGCRFRYVAPQVVAIEPDHDAWVAGDEPAVLIEFDFERDTVARLGLPERHAHE